MLTPRRLRYGFIVGGVMWLAWILSVALGPGRLDLAGQAVGTDFIQFYSAGLMARTGRIAHLYHARELLTVERAVIGPGLRGFPAYVYPPFFAWAFAPLSLLPYGIAFGLWSMLGLIGLCGALRMVGSDPRRTVAWVLTFFPVFASVSFGQNSLLSLTILAGTYALWRQRRLVTAGLTLSLLLYKPQLVVGMLALWGLECRRDHKALAGFGAGAFTLAGISFVLLPEASLAYLQFSRTVLPELTAGRGAALWHMNSVQAFFRLLMPGTGILPVVLAAAVSVVAVAGFVRLWGLHRREPAVLFAGAMLLTLIVTPHAMIYEWALLAIPAVILWDERPGDREFLKCAFVVIWLSTLVAGSLAKLQLRYLPVTLQPAVGAMLLVCFNMWRRLTGKGAHPAGGVKSGAPA